MSGAFKARVGDVLGIGAMIRDINAGKACECGHAWVEHMLCTTSLPAVEGWIECPVDGCDCRQTWSMPPETAAEVRKHSISGDSSL